MARPQTKPPHPATVAQKKAAPAKKAKPPHPATVAQKKAAPAKKAKPPHPATVAQTKAAPARKERPPHPATVAQKKAAPAKKERPPHPATVVQRAAPAKKDAGAELDGIPLSDTGKGIDIGDKLGEWTLSIVGAQADVWEHSDGKWKASCYRISGDYHVKGKNMPRRDYEMGFFNGAFRSAGGATHASERDERFNSFRSDVLAHVPGYARALALKI